MRTRAEIEDRLNKERILLSTNEPVWDDIKSSSTARNAYCNALKWVLEDST